MTGQGEYLRCSGGGTCTGCPRGRRSAARADQHGALERGLVATQPGGLSGQYCQNARRAFTHAEPLLRTTLEATLRPGIHLAAGQECAVPGAVRAQAVGGICHDSIDGT